jgi:hypothetical protein
MPALNFRTLATQCVRHPSLLVLLAGAAWRFRRRGWYRRAPFLPVPSEDYMKWRLHTAFGEENAAPDARDLIAYLKWTRSMDDHS